MSAKAKTIAAAAEALQGVAVLAAGRGRVYVSTPLKDGRAASSEGASVPSDRLEALLEAVVARLGALEDSVEFVVERVSRLTREELALLNRLWLVMVRAMEGSEFGAVDLVDLPVAAKLLPGYSAHALGWLLKRAEGLTIGAFKLERAGEDRHGALWRLAPSSMKVGARRSRDMS